ncbi:hypothetical protein ACFSCX_10925 [Bacillus salitolerans]|uniref:DUF1292 domain-containing protein n=1 Tax=Bacillus salitolerans TaxID=1437434 RepID=A0ABW4LQK4_9BACI
MVYIIKESEDKLESHLQFFFTRGGGVYTIIQSPYDDDDYPYHLVSLVNHEIIESYDDLPTIGQIQEEIGEFDKYHTDKVVVEGQKKNPK